MSEEFRERLHAVYAELQTRLARLLDQARDNKELGPDADPRELAEFMLNAWQGAMVQMKVVKSTAPLHSFERMVFERLLRSGAGGCLYERPDLVLE